MTMIFRRLAHYAVYVVAGLVSLLSLAALALRFIVIPGIENYKAEIEASASRAVGIPVRIGELHADWVHFNPRIRLRQVSLEPPGQPAPLQIAQVDATVSWFSLVVLEPRLDVLDIRQPDLDIRREKDGAILVAGIPVNRGGPTSPFPDWLLRQHAVTVTDGKLTWIDDVLGAPPLALHDVNIGLINHFGHHRFGLTASPPADAVAHLDLRGNLHGHKVDNLQDWYGQLYLRADGASAAALNTWWPWAQSAVRRSTGDVRAWLELDNGQIQSVVGDARLREVAVSLAEDLPEMKFSSISGHLGWSRKGSEQTYAVKGLRFVTAAGQRAEPADVKVSFTPSPAGKVESARVEADGLRLEALTALSGTLPLPRQAHDWIAGINPHGFIEHIDFDWLGKDHFHLATRFRDAGMNATRKLPGLTGLDGEIEADEHKGRARFDSRALHIVDHTVFRNPLDLQRLASELVWTDTPGRDYHIELKKLDIGNADLDATSQGTLDWRIGKSPVIDLTARLTHGQGSAVWRYLPHQVAESAYDWLKRSIVGGTSPETTLILRGPLDRFPFDDGSGQFQVRVRIHEGVLAYAPDWPRITGIEGWLTFEDKRMTITAERGDILGVRLAPVQGGIADLWYTQNQSLDLSGHAAGPAANFLDFIQQSPVSEHMDHFTDGMEASGNAGLDLKLHIPLDNVSDTQVNGRIALAGNDITLDPRLPPLTQARGVLTFTDSAVKGDNLNGQMLGQPLAISLGSEHGGRIHARVKSVVNADLLGRWLPAGLARRVSGSTPVQADITVHQHLADVRLDSRLAGLAIDLPAPIGKAAATEVPLSANLQDRGDGAAPIAFRYGDSLTGALLLGGGQNKVSLMLGGLDAPPPTEDGITVNGTLRRLDLDAWRRLGLAPHGSGGSLPIRDISLTLNELQVADRLFHDINVHARPGQDDWAVQLSGREAKGEIHYTFASGGKGDSFRGEFEKLAIPDAIPGSGQARQPLDPDDLPRKIHLTAKSFSYGKQNLGDLKLDLTPGHDGLAVDDLALATPEARLESRGWLSTSPLRTTRLDLTLKSGDLGALMRRIGYSQTVKGGELDVRGNLNWLGRPETLNLERLNGSLKGELRNGRFLQLDPGAAKLLGILSLQALPRRITLDFRDIFSEGFAFDRIHGDVTIDRGIGYLPDLAIEGPAANIHMKGAVDLAHERQELRLHIQPRLDEGVAVGAALLGGPVAGVGALVATKILKNPVSQAASFEYLVTGTWAEPTVTKLARPVAETPATAR